MTRRIDRLGCAMFACLTACQSDEILPAAAPMTGGAPAVATMNPAPAPSAAGAPAAAISGAPAIAGAAGAPAAAEGGNRAAMPGAAAGAPAAAPTAGMPSTGHAGSTAAPKPAMQPDAERPPAAGSCELPYTRAVRATIALTWAENLGFLGGTGPAVVWAKVTYSRSADGALEVEARPCGVVMPPATTSVLAGGLKAEIQVPFTAFDSPNMPVDRMPATQREDRSLEFTYRVVLGAQLADPNGTWPTAANLMPFDHDGDGSPGLTSLPLEGPEYVSPPSSIAQTESLDRLYIATRAQLKTSITPACTGPAEGTVQPLGFDTAVIGCHVKNRDDCDAMETRFIANASPRYMAGESGSWTEVEVVRDANCPDVRAALPQP